MIKKVHDDLRLQIRHLIVEVRWTVDLSPMAQLRVARATPADPCGQAAPDTRPTPDRPATAGGGSQGPGPLAIRPLRRSVNG